jgi:hypothetical protein
MAKFGFATIAASAAAILGFAVGGAQASVTHHRWIHDNQQRVSTPKVDTGVHQSR